MSNHTPLVSLTDNSDNLLRRKGLEPLGNRSLAFRQNENPTDPAIFIHFSVATRDLHTFFSSLAKASRSEVLIRAIKKCLTKARVR